MSFLFSSMRALSFQICSDLEKEVATPGNLAVACFLLQHGANIDAQNHRHITPAMHVTDMHALDVMRRYVRCVCEYSLLSY